MLNIVRNIVLGSVALALVGACSPQRVKVVSTPVTVARNVEDVRLVPFEKDVEVAKAEHDRVTSANIRDLTACKIANGRACGIEDEGLAYALKVETKLVEAMEALESAKKVAAVSTCPIDGTPCDNQ